MFNVVLAWVTGLPHLLAQAAGEQLNAGNISVGLLVVMQLQIANLQVKVNALMKGKRK